MLSIIRRFENWALCYYDSTRSTGLIRMGLVLLIWSEWGNELLLLRDMHWISVLSSIAFFATTSLMFAGIRSRAASIATAVTILSIYLMRSTWQHHHTYLLLISTFFIALTPCGKSYSCDRWLAIRRARHMGLPIPAEFGNLWGLRLISIQVSLIYFWTAYDKLNWTFLSGQRLQYFAYFYYAGLSYKNFPGFTSLCAIIAVITVSLELSLAFGLFVSRLHKYLIPTGIVMHGLFYLLLPVRTFSLTMMLLYLSFIPASTMHRFIDRIHGTEGSNV